MNNKNLVIIYGVRAVLFVGILITGVLKYPKMDSATLVGISLAYAWVAEPVILSLFPNETDENDE